MSRLEGTFGHLLRAAVSIALLAAVWALGQVPMGKPSGTAVVRVAVRSTGARVEVCRQLSADELAAVPAHMRRSEVCDWLAPAYRLRVHIDDELRLERLVDPGGVKGDRPLIVDVQMPAAPGPARLAVELAPQPPAALSPPFAEAAQRLPLYRFDQEVILEADRIALVRLVEPEGRLELYATRRTPSTTQPTGGLLNE